MYKLISGSSNEPLAEKIAAKLGKPLTKIIRKQFSDGEMFVKVEESIRGENCFIIQSTCAPTNDNLMELLLIIDALKRGSAKTINVVTPYFGYARQDRKNEPRVPISARLVADMIEKAGAHRVIVLDLHAAQIQGFFNIPVDNLFSSPTFIKYIHSLSDKLKDPIIASPDAGGVVRARYLAKKVGFEGLAIIDKRREKANESEVMNVIGDVVGKDVIIIDDMIDTAGTLLKAATAFKKNGARSVRACITHGVLSGAAYENLTYHADDLEELIITDTIPISEKAYHKYPEAIKKITVLSVDKLMSKVIKRIIHNKSVNGLFE
jgi:ribose-phosphate pyrophosphokinase